MEKTVDVSKLTNTFSDAVKLAANLTEAAKERKNMESISDNSNNSTQNPNQQVQIHIGDQEKDKKPVVIHEKPETHIHKDFPEGRSLTDKECELALAKAKMENERKLLEMDYQKAKYEQERRDRLLKEAQEREDKEKRRIKNEKRAKVRNVIAAIVGVLGAVGIGYSIYADNRDYRNRMANSQTSEAPVISGEGSVE